MPSFHRKAKKMKAGVSNVSLSILIIFVDDSPLGQIQQKHGSEYHKLTVDEKAVFAAEHQEGKDRAKKFPRATGRGRIQDVSNVVRNMSLLVRGTSFLGIRLPDWRSFPVCRLVSALRASSVL